MLVDNGDAYTREIVYAAYTLLREFMLTVQRLDNRTPVVEFPVAVHIVVLKPQRRSR